MNSTQSVDLPGTLTVFTGSFLGTLLVVFAFLLAIAGLLMPLYVIAISDRMKKLLRQMQQQQVTQERQLEELRKIRQRWDA